MMQCGPARTFKSMDENTSITKLELKYENAEISPADLNEGNSLNKGQSFTLEEDDSKRTSVSPIVIVLQNVTDETNSHKISAEISGEVTEKSAAKTCLKPNNENDFAQRPPEPCPSSSQLNVNCPENKENASIPPVITTQDNNQQEHRLDQRIQADTSMASTKGQKSSTEDIDPEITKPAQEEGCVNVVFPGTVTQDGCCRFVSEILKCILYQRQQLPMTYDQLVYSQKKQQASMQEKDVVSRRPVQSADMDRRKCHQTLQELEEVLQQLEALFSLSWVPRVLLLMGGSIVLPKELYEINMEALVVAAGDKSLRVSSCLRQLFRTLFVADLLSDPRPVRLMPTTVMVLAHRDCGVGWFRPKLQFKVPTRVKSKVIALSTDPCSCRDLKRDESDWEDYVWFQAPMTIKGFSN